MRLCSIPVVVLSLLLFVFSPRRLFPPPYHFPLLPAVSPSYSSSSFSSCPSLSSSSPSSSSLSRPSSPPVAGFPTSPLVVVAVGVPTQQSRWGAEVSHHMRARRHIAPPPASPLLVVSPLFRLVVYTPRRWIMPFIVVAWLWLWSCWALLLVVGSSFVVGSSLVVR